MWQEIDQGETEKMSVDRKYHFGILITVTVACICLVVVGAAFVGLIVKEERAAAGGRAQTQPRPNENGVLNTRPPRTTTQRRLTTTGKPDFVLFLHWGPDKMGAFLQTIVLNSYP